MINWNEHNYETNFCYVKDIRVLWILDWPVKKYSIKNYFPKIWEGLYPILNKVERGSRDSHIRTRVGHSFCNKNFQILEVMMQMKIVITLHVYLLLRQLIEDCSIVLTVFLKTGKKATKKIAFCIESQAEFLVELKHNNLKSSFTPSIAKAKHGDSSETYENPSWLEMRNGA